MKNGKKLIILTTLAVLIVGLISGCNNKDEEVNDDKPKKQVKTQTIKLENEVTSTLTASGTIIPKQYAVIRSLAQGTLEYITPVGFNITTGQPLFQIRDDNVENNYFNTLQNVRQTNVIADERVTQAELALSSARARLDLLEKNLETVQKQTDQSLKNAQRSAATTYNSAYNSLSQIFTFISNGTVNNFDFRYQNLSTPYSNLLNDARLQYLAATGSFIELSNQIDESNLDDDLNKIYNAVNKTKSLIDSMVVLLQNELSGSTAIASDTLIIANYQTQINAHTTGIAITQNALKNTTINNQLALDQALNQLTLSQIEVENSQISFESAQNGAALEKTIVQSQFDNAAYGYSNLSLASPFSGTILSNFIEPGQQVNMGQEIIELGNLSIVEIVVEIDAEFAKNLKQGDKIKINDTYDGFISEVEPAGDITSGKIKVTVQSENPEGYLVAGDIAEVKFTLIYQEPNLIIIPIKAATIESVSTYVFVVEDGKAIKREITLGQVFGSKVSVASGLQENDQIILRNGVFISEGEEIEIE